MPAAAKSDSLALTSSEAACLDAIRAGASAKTQIALRAGLDQRRAERALAGLSEHKLIVRRDRRWALTRKATSTSISVTPDKRSRRGRAAEVGIRSGSSAERLLRLLDRPRRGSELATELGLSPQRVHQLVVRLVAFGLVRTGDPDRPLHTVARQDDHTVLLRVGEEKVLSAIPANEATTIGRIARASKRSVGETMTAVRVLVEQGLVGTAGHSRRGELYCLTPTGRSHWQRRPEVRAASLPPLPVRSERVRLVLDHLNGEGPTRTVRVGEALGIPHESMNGLMQYLKRKGLVQKAGTGLNDPHEITPEGKAALAGMHSRTR